MSLCALLVFMILMFSYVDLYIRIFVSFSETEIAFARRGGIVETPIVAEAISSSATHQDLLPNASPTPKNATATMIVAIGGMKMAVRLQRNPH